MEEFISVDDAQQRILSRIGRTHPERITLTNASGRTLALTINAPEDSPRFDNSAMDGYAVRFEDLAKLPRTLVVSDTVAAGAVSNQTLQAGQAMRIMTGAPIPPGADTVVQQELCTREGDNVIIRELPNDQQGANIRYAGTYMKTGQPVVRHGSVISPADIGILATFRHSTVTVYRKPVVAILSTGDELLEIDQTPGPGQIVNSNAYMLEALVHQAGAIPLVLPIARDQREDILAAFKNAINSADIVVSSGGVSVGDFDFVREVLDELSGGMEFWRIRLKPGKPLAFGIANNERATPIIGLPGNPASSFVGFHLFVKPAIAIASGQSIDQVMPATIRAKLSATAHGARGRRAYISGRLQFQTGSDAIFTPGGDQSSGNAALFCGSNALGFVEEGVRELHAGDSIDVILL